VSTIAQSQDTLPVGTWGIDPVHSHVNFGVEYMVGTFRGSFSPVDAQLVVADDGSVELAGSAKVESIKVQDENLTGHLLSPDFFDAERTPEITFRSSDVSRSGSDVTIKGELTIKGQTQPVELRGTIVDPITDPYGQERLGLKVDGTVDRTKFGLNWNNPLPSGEPALANEVKLAGELYLVKA
jgi:polyisoprenoid-binding protein YceI